MNRNRILTWLFAGFAVLALAMLLKFQHDMSRAVNALASPVRTLANSAISKVVGPQEANDVGSNPTLPTKDAVSASLSSEPPFVATWSNAVAAGRLVLAKVATENFQANALDVGIIDQMYRTDGWGNPFCIQKFDSTVVVLSSGPSGQRLNCSAMAVTKDRTSHLPRGKLVRLSDGRLLLAMSTSEK